MSRKATAALLITAAVLTIAAFTVLGSVGLLLLRRPRTATAAPARARSNAEGR